MNERKWDERKECNEVKGEEWKWREKNESEESTKFTGFYILLRIITGGDLIIY